MRRRPDRNVWPTSQWRTGALACPSLNWKENRTGEGACPPLGRGQTFLSVAFCLLRRHVCRILRDHVDHRAVRGDLPLAADDAHREAAVVDVAEAHLLDDRVLAKF